MMPRRIVKRGGQRGGQRGGGIAPTGVGGTRSNWGGKTPPKVRGRGAPKVGTKKPPLTFGAPPRWPGPKAGKPSPKRAGPGGNPPGKQSPKRRAPSRRK